MEGHFKLSDAIFEEQFRSCTLDPTLFSHEAHIRLAWINVTKYGLSQAEENLCKAIARFDQHFGDGKKYNKTVTIAAVKAVNHFIDKSSSLNFKEFIQEFPRLKFNFKALLDCHYGFDVFNNEQAKQTYLEPDLMPF